MRVSEYFLPLLQEEPREATIRSHSLMLRAGIMRQLCSGIYTLLPLGLKVLKKVEQIIRKEMNHAKCLEMLMPCLQPAGLWHQSERYNTYGKEMLKMQDRHAQELIFGPTAEEIATEIFRNNIKSYQELPKIFYQMQWKFRDEIRPRFGILRAREFLMKDAYSFDIDKQSAEKSYWKMYKTYLKIFHKLGLKVLPLEADSGAIGGNFSHEFHVLANVGESKLHFDQRIIELLTDDIANEQIIEKISSMYAASEEKYDPMDKRIIANNLVSSMGIEVGHIFLFSTKYSLAMNAKVKNKNGEFVYPEMGSYGIGISRVIAAIIETSNDERGIKWPSQIAPFKLGIANLDIGNENCVQMANELYQNLTKDYSEDVLYDDTTASVGQKFALQDLIGVPIQIRVGRRSISEEESLEIKTRSDGTIEHVAKQNLPAYIATKFAH